MAFSNTLLPRTPSVAQSPLPYDESGRGGYVFSPSGYYMCYAQDDPQAVLASLRSELDSIRTMLCRSAVMTGVDPQKPLREQVAFLIQRVSAPQQMVTPQQRCFSPCAALQRNGSFSQPGGLSLSPTSPAGAVLGNAVLLKRSSSGLRLPNEAAAMPESPSPQRAESKIGFGLQRSTSGNGSMRRTASGRVVSFINLKEEPRSRPINAAVAQLPMLGPSQAVEQGPTPVVAPTPPRMVSRPNPLLSREQFRRSRNI